MLPFVKVKEYKQRFTQEFVCGNASVERKGKVKSDRNIISIISILGNAHLLVVTSK